MKLIQNENYVCMGGGNSSENWGLLDSSDPSDYFIHLSSFPSGYVILRVLSPEELSSDRVPPGLMEAALMCKNWDKVSTSPRYHGRLVYMWECQKGGGTRRSNIYQ